MVSIYKETNIMGTAQATIFQMQQYLNEHNQRSAEYMHLPQLYLDEGAVEGVRGDVAFCQALKETGFFKFGGDVSPKQHNYAGLGATGGVPGLAFPDDQIGVRAQVQHLKAYATTKPLKKVCVDPRYKYVKKGCAPTAEQLSGKWAVPGYSGYKDFSTAWEALDTYGHHIAKMLRDILLIGQDKSMLWVVQVGAFQNMENAIKLQTKLEEVGVISKIVAQRQNE